MTRHIINTLIDKNENPHEQIFIGREQQLYSFEDSLYRWKKLIFDADPNNDLVLHAPSPNDKIQGFVALLYGHGGFGKSTLLKHYHMVASQKEFNLNISTTVDWEFASNHSLFNLSQNQEVDAIEYFKLLCVGLATALNKKLDDFKNYRKAVREVEEAQKQANKTVDSLQKDERFAFLRQVTGPSLVQLVKLVGLVNPHIGTAVNVANSIINNDKLKELVGEGAEVTAEQLVQFHTRLQDKLGVRLGDYLEPGLKLGLNLGRDLNLFAKSFPLLIFFDTYEEIDEGDYLLRIVMGAAGLRVGWVLAGRDNLWGGWEQQERSISLEYGYKDILFSDRRLSVNFNASDIGAFTLSDIIEYFMLLRKILNRRESLPKITEEDATHIWHETKGVPLAVKIAADIYEDAESVDSIIKGEEGRQEIVDRMVRRYLLHTHANQEEKAKLYALAMLRRSDQPKAIAAALNLTDEVANNSYPEKLSQLHRRYSFIFTENKQPSLHQEVRYFLRLWLLEHSKEPHIRVHAHFVWSSSAGKSARDGRLAAMSTSYNSLCWYARAFHTKCA